MKLISLWKRVSMESKDTASPETCDACGTERGPFIKVSLGKDFFGRPYDRLSPSSDQKPKWYCEGCSQQKNLQRDFRDIQSEVSKWQAGQASELTHADHVSRSQVRLREIHAYLEGAGGASPFLESTAVINLLHHLETGLGKSPSNHEFQNI